MQEPKSKEHGGDWKDMTGTGTGTGTGTATGTGT